MPPPENESYVVDPELKAWASERVCTYIDACNEAGSVRAGARLLGLSRATVQEGIKTARARQAQGARQDAVSPRGTAGFVVREVATKFDGEEEPVESWVREGPEPIHGYGGVGEGDARDGLGPYFVKGVSTLFGPAGEQRAQWLKTDIDREKWFQHVKAGVQAFYQGPIEIPERPALVVSTAPIHDVVPWLNIGDAHLGMLAYEAETGENFDLKIAERELCAAVAMVIDELGYYERLVINDLGDFTHYENVDGLTEASGHRLDKDGRYGLMIRVYSRVMRFMVEKALEKADTVDVIINQGNHSRKNDLWMAELLRVAYGGSNRVNVLNNDDVFIGYRMGKTFVMTHHSDKCPPAKLASVMATDFAADWGESEFRYIDIGHIHHRMTSKEHPGVLIESWNILAPRDNFAHAGGWRSRQSMTVVHRSRTFGEVGRRVLPVQQVRASIVAAMADAGQVAPVRNVRRAFAA